MRELLEALKGAHLLGRLTTAEGVVSHYLLANGKVLEVVQSLRQG